MTNTLQILKKHLINPIFIAFPVLFAGQCFTNAFRNEQNRSIYVYLGIAFFLLLCYEIRQQLLHKKDFESSKDKKDEPPHTDEK